MNEQLQAGDWVEVRAPREIANTLDANGTLDGLPFMPEMIELCGRRFRVLRRAEKICLEATAGDYVIRQFSRDDVFLLEGLRCSGAHHNGCQRLCMFLWRMAWLRKVEAEQRVVVADLAGLGAFQNENEDPARPLLLPINGADQHNPARAHETNANTPEVFSRCPVGSRWNLGNDRTDRRAVFPEGEGSFVRTSAVGGESLFQGE